MDGRVCRFWFLLLHHHRRRLTTFTGHGLPPFLYGWFGRIPRHLHTYCLDRLPTNDVYIPRLGHSHYHHLQAAFSSPPAHTRAYAHRLPHHFISHYRDLISLTPLELCLFHRPGLTKTLYSTGTAVDVLTHTATLLHHTLPLHFLPPG